MIVRPQYTRGYAPHGCMYEFVAKNLGIDVATIYRHKNFI